MNTGFENIDKTVHLTQSWLKEIELEGHFDSRQEAYASLRATLHTLRDRLPVDEATHLGAQLPMLIRGIYYEGWKPSQTPETLRSPGEFERRVRERLEGQANVDARMAIRSVFTVLDRQISQGQIEDIRSNLPDDMLQSLKGETV